MRAEEDLKNKTQLEALARRFKLLRITSIDGFAQTVEVVDHLVRLSNKVLPIKSYFNAAIEFQRKEEGRHVCIEDEFVAACAYLDVVVAKSGHIYYLDGEAPDRRETKKHRQPLKLTDEVLLKDLSGFIARPDDKRGKVERGQVIAGGNHLSRLLRLQSLMYKAVEMHDKAVDNRKVDVMKAFDLTSTDYEQMMAMARRAGLTKVRNRSRDPANKFTLRTELFAKVTERAQTMGVTPQKALNLMLGDFFAILEQNADRIQRKGKP